MIVLEEACSLLYSNGRFIHLLRKVSFGNMFVKKLTPAIVLEKYLKAGVCVDNPISIGNEYIHTELRTVPKTMTRKEHAENIMSCYRHAKRYTNWQWLISRELVRLLKNQDDQASQVDAILKKIDKEDVENLRKIMLAKVVKNGLEDTSTYVALMSAESMEELVAVDWNHEQVLETANFIIPLKIDSPVSSI